MALAFAAAMSACELMVNVHVTTDIARIMRCKLLSLHSHCITAVKGWRHLL